MVITLNIDPREIKIDPKNGKIIFSYTDILTAPEWPEGPLVELISGDLFMVPSPNIKHQRISKNIYELISDFLKIKSLGELFYAPIDILLSQIDVVVPDLFFVLNENKEIIHGKNIVGTPDLVVEILSGNVDHDMKFKKNLYEKYMIKEYWIVDPVNEDVKVFNYDVDTNSFEEATIYSRSKIIQSKVIVGLKCDVDKIFD